MKYFIDFEATQFTKEIISVGCVREDGNTFYSLIKPKRMASVTDFITSLTGITKQMLEKERTSDKVFSDFFDWLLEAADGNATFYCYGDQDIEFLQKNLKDRTNDFKAQAALSIIAMNLIDYTNDIKNYFGLIKNIQLKKVFHYFYPSDKLSCHNSLFDAEMLYKVYKIIDRNKFVMKECPFPEYMGELVFTTPEDFNNYDIHVNDTVYETLDDAVEFVISLLKSCGQKGFDENNIKRRVMKAINNKVDYFGLKWKVCRKESYGSKNGIE